MKQRNVFFIYLSKYDDKYLLLFFPMWLLWLRTEVLTVETGDCEDFFSAGPDIVSFDGFFFLAGNYGYSGFTAFLSKYILSIFCKQKLTNTWQCLVCSMTPRGCVLCTS